MNHRRARRNECQDGVEEGGADHHGVAVGDVADEDGDVADDANTAVGAILLQGLPLFEEGELQEALERQLVFQVLHGNPSSPNSSPSQKPKAKTLDLQGISVVEAGGIEPPSEDPPEMATTRLVRKLELAARPPTDRLPRSQPIEVSGHRPIGRLRHPSPLNDASTHCHGRAVARR